MSKRNYLKELKESTSEKYFKRYVPPDLTQKQKEETAKTLILRREGKSNKETKTYGRKPKQSGFTKTFNDKYGYIEDKSESNLAKVFRVPKKDIEDVYKRGYGAWTTSGSRLGVPREAWAKARVYKYLLNVIKVRKGGEPPKTQGGDRQEVINSAKNSKLIPKEKK